MSTAFIGMAAHLIGLCGMPVSIPVYEPMICAQNHYCHGTSNSDQALTAALQAELEAGRRRNVSILLKTHLSSTSSGYSRALHSFNAPAAAAYRANRLDQLLCKVKDCMTQSSGAWLVDPVTRHRVNCSMTRRSIEQPMQPLVHFPPQTFSYLRSTVLSGVHASTAFAGKLQGLGWRDAKAVATEDLLLFEHDTSEAGLSHSVRAWSVLLTALQVPGVSTCTPRIRLYLQQPSLRQRAPPPRHDTVIDNAAEVWQALRGLPPEVVAKYWRGLPKQGQKPII